MLEIIWSVHTGTCTLFETRAPCKPHWINSSAWWVVDWTKWTFWPSRNFAQLYWLRRFKLWWFNLRRSEFCTHLCQPRRSFCKRFSTKIWRISNPCLGRWSWKGSFFFFNLTKFFWLAAEVVLWNSLLDGRHFEVYRIYSRQWIRHLSFYFGSCKATF